MPQIASSQSLPALKAAMQAVMRDKPFMVIAKQPTGTFLLYAGAVSTEHTKAEALSDHPLALCQEVEYASKDRVSQIMNRRKDDPKYEKLGKIDADPLKLRPH